MLTANPKQYLDLLQSFPPRPIKTEADYVAVQEVVDTLLDTEELTDDQKDYLNLLGMLIHEYEEKHVNIPDLAGIDVLKALVDEFSLTQEDLISMFETESATSAILSGHEKLTVEHIEKLSAFFQVSPSVFFG